MTIRSWLVLVVPLLGLIYWMCSSYSEALWIIIVAVVFLVCWSMLRSRIDRKKLEALAKSRQDETICGFARSFDPGVVDTWVIRAVYEQLQRELQVPNFPIRAADHLINDLLLDAAELDMSVVFAISERTGRSLDKTRDNPFSGKVATAKDLVFFFNVQPRN